MAIAAALACALVVPSAVAKNPSAPGQLKKAAQAVGAPAPARKVAPGQVRKAAAGKASKMPPGQAKKGRVPPGIARKQAAAGAAPVAARPVATTATTSAAAIQSSPSPTAAAAHRRAAARHRAAVRRHRAAVRRHRAAVRRAARRRAAAPVTAPAIPAAIVPVAAAATPSTTTQSAPAGKPAPRHATPKHSPAKGGQRDQSPVTVVGHTVTNTVRDIVHEIPAWAKALIVALAALLGVAAVLILLGALRNRRLRAQRAALLADVGALQAALLPEVPAALGALAVSVAYRPAEGLAAGGDFYDVFPLDGNRVGVLVGDVSGHGRESLRSATFTRHMVRSYIEAGLAPRTALQLAGRVVDEHGQDEFATIVAAIHDPEAGTISYASAGHPPAIVLGPAAHEPLIVASSPPLGVGNPTGLRQTTVPFPPGSTMWLFTDGLFEGRLGKGMYGRRRLGTAVRGLPPGAGAQDLIDRVVHEVDAVRDDIAVCMIHVQGGAAPASTVRVEELEVESGELERPRVRRFLRACGVEASEIDELLQQARRRAAQHGSVVLRVRLAEDRSGVDVLAPDTHGAGAPVALLRSAQAV